MLNHKKKLSSQLSDHLCHLIIKILYWFSQIIMRHTSVLTRNILSLSMFRWHLFPTFLIVWKLFSFRCLKKYNICSRRWKKRVWCSIWKYWMWWKFECIAGYLFDQQSETTQTTYPFYKSSGKFMMLEVLPYLLLLPSISWFKNMKPKKNHCLRNTWC